MAVRQPAVGPAAANLATLSLASAAGGVGGGLEVFFIDKLPLVLQQKKTKWSKINIEKIEKIENVYFQLVAMLSFEVVGDWKSFVAEVGFPLFVPWYFRLSCTLEDLYP